MGKIFLGHAYNIARRKSYPMNRGMFLDWEVIFRSWRGHKIHLTIIKLLSSDNYGKNASQNIFLDCVANIILMKKPYRFLMLIWKVQSKYQQRFFWCAESNMQKSEQEVSKDSSCFPFTFHSKRSGLQVSPFLLNTCEPCALGHHQCISTPSPVGFLHLRKDRDDLYVYTRSLTAGRITCK